MSTIFLEVHGGKDDGRDHMLLYTLHQLVYTRSGDFTCTRVIRIILIGDLLGHAVGLKQNKIRTTGLYSKLGMKTYATTKGSCK